MANGHKSDETAIFHVEVALNTAMEARQPPQSAERRPSRRKDEQPRGARFPYGNYPSYQAFRNAGDEMHDDVRVLQMPADWFHGKDVLDIGCNLGSVTIAIGGFTAVLRLVFNSDKKNHC